MAEADRAFLDEQLRLLATPYSAASDIPEEDDVPVEGDETAHLPPRVLRNVVSRSRCPFPQCARQEQVCPGQATPPFHLPQASFCHPQARFASSGPLYPPAPPPIPAPAALLSSSSEIPIHICTGVNTKYFHCLINTICRQRPGEVQDIHPLS